VKGIAAERECLMILHTLVDEREKVGRKFFEE
jgi:hypothetical protein